MSDNHEIESESSSDEEMEDLFLSPDDSAAEEVEFPGGEAQDASATASAADIAPPQEGPPSMPAVPTDSGRVAELEAERDDYRNRMMRVAADLENFRKRTSREKDDLRKYGIDRVVLELLPVIDNLERALEHADKSESSTTIVDGVRMVHRQFITALEKHGVRGYEAKGEQFDPTRHEAIQQIETSEHPTGLVLEQYQKGYYLHERLIRPALVVVARNPSGAVAPAAPEVEPAREAAAEGAPSAEGPAPADDETRDPTEPLDDTPSSDPSDGSDESAVNQ